MEDKVCGGGVSINTTTMRSSLATVAVIAIYPVLTSISSEPVMLYNSSIDIKFMTEQKRSEFRDWVVTSIFVFLLLAKNDATTCWLKIKVINMRTIET